MTTPSSRDLSNEVQAEQAGTLEAILIQLTRNYDATMMLLKHFDAREAEWLADFHEQGGVLSPNPSLVVGNDAAVLGTNGELDGTDSGSP